MKSIQLGRRGMGHAANSDFPPSFRAPPPQTAKPPLVGPVAQTSRVRIPFHIPADSEKVMVILDGERLQSALIQMAVSCGVIMSMMARGVR